MEVSKSAESVLSILGGGQLQVFRLWPIFTTCLLLKNEVGRPTGYINKWPVSFPCFPSSPPKKSRKMPGYIRMSQRRVSAAPEDAAGIDPVGEYCNNASVHLVV